MSATPAQAAPGRGTHQTCILQTSWVTVAPVQTLGRGSCCGAARHRLAHVLLDVHQVLLDDPARGSTRRSVHRLHGAGTRGGPSSSQGPAATYTSCNNQVHILQTHVYWGADTVAIHSTSRKGQPFTFRAVQTNSHRTAAVPSDEAPPKPPLAVHVHTLSPSSNLTPAWTDEGVGGKGRRTPTRSRRR